MMSNIPKLRFKEFSEEWEEKKLSKFSKIERGKFSPRPRNNPIYYNGNIPFVQTSDVVKSNGRINAYTQTLNEKGLQVSKLFNKGTILITIAANIGYSGILEIDMACPDSLIGLTCDNNTSNVFLNYLLEIEQPRMDYLAIDNAQKNINIEFLKPYKFYLPLKQEQEKIASFLSSVDTKIKQLTSKESLLKEYKKGVMKKIFNQEIRFKAADGSELCDWEEKSLKTIFKERKLSATKAEGYEHISLTTEGVVPKSERYERDFLVSDDSSKKYKVTKLDDICYNPANLKFGVISRNKYSDGIFSPIYVTFEVINVDIKFIEYFVTRWDFINRVRKYEEGTVYERQAVKPEDFLKFSIPIPSKEEQTKIANFLSEIDSKIEQVQTQLNSTKEFKKALLQQMFV